MSRKGSTQGTKESTGVNAKRKKLLQTKLDVHFSFRGFGTVMNDETSGEKGEQGISRKDIRRETVAGATLLRATALPSEKDTLIPNDSSSGQNSTVGDRDRTVNAKAGTSKQRHFWDEDSEDASDVSFVAASPVSEEVDDNMKTTFLGSTMDSLIRPLLPLPKLRANPGMHTVLFDTSTLDNVSNGKPPKPYPRCYYDRWDGDHVRMPCSSQSEYPINQSELVERWTLVQEALQRTWKTFDDLKTCILSYNDRYAAKWNFSGLERYIDKLEEEERECLFSVTLPNMAKLALQLPEIVTQPIPLLKRGMRRTVTMTQHQAACLLANAFFCTFPRRNQRRSGSEYSNYPEINFHGLFGSGKVIRAKLDFIFHYFRRVTERMPEGVLSFERTGLDEFPDWSSSTAPLTKLHICRKGTIEDFGEGMLQVDFANKYLGGGVLRHGSVQEEIRFLICPELMVPMLFAESLAKNESFIMTGCERFSYYTGYASSLKWLKSFQDTTPRDEWGRRRVQVVAIDAVPFANWCDQFEKPAIDRELNKAFCGFARPSVDREYLSAVATGNWGCGAFGGDKELKSLIQIMAAASAGRDVAYFTFDDDTFMRKLYNVYEMLVQKRNAVGLVYELLMQYSSYIASSPAEPVSLFEFIRRFGD